MILIYILLMSSEPIKVKTYTTNQDVIVHYTVPNFESKVKIAGGQEFIELYLSDVPPKPPPKRFTTTFTARLSSPKSTERDNRDFRPASTGVSSDIGKPCLPVIRKFIEVPEDAELSIETQIGRVQEFTLAYPVYPTQPPVPKIPNYTPIFTLDNASYMVDNFSPSNTARIVSIFGLRGRRVAIVEVYPIQYNPVQNKVRFVSDIKVTIVFHNADWGTTLAKISHFYTPYYESRYRLIENYDYFNLFREKTLPIGYLIITPDSWYNSILPLSNWKVQKGYSVSIANLSEIGGGDTTTVRNYIKTVYDSCPVPPTFVLLVGDVDSIGYFIDSMNNNLPTDLYYSTMTDSDYFPDIDVSRFSISTQFELDSLVSKTIKYEQCDWSNGTDWCNKMYFIASADGGCHQIAESTHQYSMQVARSHNVLCDSLWLFYHSGTPIIDALNEGRAWVIYSGHGSSTSWSEPGFSVSNVHSLTNADKPAFVGTFACYSGRYTVGDCFSESWARSGYRGGIASFASSVTSYWDEDDILQRRMFDAAFDYKITSVMGMLNKGKLLLSAYYGITPTVQRYFEMYNMIGDGSINAYWDGFMYADHNVGNVKFTVTSQGACGFTSPNGSGSGFCYPNPGINYLYIGSLWIGNSKDYVVDRDTENDSDWIVTTLPDGRLKIGDNYFSDQDGWAMYSDAGHPNPKGITVKQRSWAWASAPYNDFVILQYLVKNEGPNIIPGLYVGQFMDFDIDSGSSNDNNVSTDSMRKFVYQWSNSHNEYMGVTLLDSNSVANLSAINIPAYMFQGDFMRFKFLNKDLHFPNSSIVGNYGVIASAGPFNLLPAQQVIVSFAIIAGDSLRDALYNSDMAQELYDSITGIEETSVISIGEIFSVRPNPFIGKTVIEFNVGTRQGVSLQIYDLAGRMTKSFSLIPNPQSPITRVVWDGKDNYNRSVPSGIYFCKISSSANEAKIKKLILIK
ncbi:MAG: T9SS type A sorting domain-containing protein [Candidatus Stahlbacteria bacterium]|nr:T9SS type A sorting domain-containing protein [Candidatus Stahlbacteria bacterium]